MVKVRYFFGKKITMTFEEHMLTYLNAQLLVKSLSFKNMYKSLLEVCGLVLFFSGSWQNMTDLTAKVRHFVVFRKDLAL